MSWFKSKPRNPSKSITCPYCNETQEISAESLIVSCKKCNKNINVKRLSEEKKKAPSESSNKVEKKQKTSPKPRKDAALSGPAPYPPKGESPKKGGSALDRKVTEESPTVSSQPVAGKEVADPSSPSFYKREPQSKQTNIKCSHCGTEQSVPNIALVSFCSNCGQRINLQNYQMKVPFRGELETRGTIEITREGDVEGKLDVGEVRVEGRMKGEIIAEKRALLHPGCFVEGTIISKNLIVLEGARFIGKAEINPVKDMEIKQGFLGF